MVGDFGDSVRFKVPVSEVLWPRLANTGILGGIALFFASIIGLTLGVIAGMREGGGRDRAVSVTSIDRQSVGAGKSGPERVDLGGRRIIKKKKHNKKTTLD